MNEFSAAKFPTHATLAMLGQRVDKVYTGVIVPVKTLLAFSQEECHPIKEIPLLPEIENLVDSLRNELAKWRKFIVHHDNGHLYDSLQPVLSDIKLAVGNRYLNETELKILKALNMETDLELNQQFIDKQACMTGSLTMPFAEMRARFDAANHLWMTRKSNEQKKDASSISVVAEEAVKKANDLQNRREKMRESLEATVQVREELLKKVTLVSSDANFCKATSVTTEKSAVDEEDEEEKDITEWETVPCETEWEASESQRECGTAPCQTEWETSVPQHECGKGTSTCGWC